MSCACGCGQPTSLAKQTRTKLGHVKGQPVPYVSGHANKRTGLADRYVVNANDCWLWYGFLDEDGYAQCSVNNKTVRVYKYHYELKYGPVPEGTQLDHLCKVRRCVNPDHLEPVTGAVNTQRGVNAKLSPEQVLEIRARHAKGEKQKDLAVEFGVGDGHISMIVNRLTWRNI